MTTPATTVTAAEEPTVDTVHPDAIRQRDCISGECLACGENFPDDDYAYHFDTRTEMLAAIRDTEWYCDANGLWCGNCLPDAAELVSADDIEPHTLGWLTESSCFTIHCTRCQLILESDYGEAHFHSTQAALEAAVHARWMVSPNQVWCRACTALVEPAPTPHGTCS
jgi:hypothetical protein